MEAPCGRERQGGWIFVDQGEIHPAGPADTAYAAEGAPQLDSIILASRSNEGLSDAEQTNSTLEAFA